MWFVCTHVMCVHVSSLMQAHDLVLQSVFVSCNDSQTVTECKWEWLPAEAAGVGVMEVDQEAG